MYTQYVIKAKKLIDKKIHKDVPDPNGAELKSLPEVSVFVHVNVCICKGIHVSE